APGMMGVFFREFTVTLMAAIAVSGVVSQTLTPSLCGVFLRPEREQRRNRWLDLLERMQERMLGVYMRVLNRALRHPRLVSLQPLLLVVITVFLFKTISGSLFPPQDTGLIWARATAGSTLSFEDMTQRLQKVTDLLMADPAVEYVG